MRSNGCKARTAPERPSRLTGEHNQRIQCYYYYFFPVGCRSCFPSAGMQLLFHHSGGVYILYTAEGHVAAGLLHVRRCCLINSLINSGNRVPCCEGRCEGRRTLQHLDAPCWWDNAGLHLDERCLHAATAAVAPAGCVLCTRLRLLLDLYPPSHPPSPTCCDTLNCCAATPSLPCNLAAPFLPTPSQLCEVF